MANQEGYEDVEGVDSDPRGEIEPSSAILSSTATQDSALSKAEIAPSEDSQKHTLTHVTDEKTGKDQQTAIIPTDTIRDAVELEDDEGEIESAPTGTKVGKKKRKKSKPKSKRGLNAPTGFEEYYVDAPLTPAEFEEEKQIYDPSYKFTQRIETAIQRFVAKRKLDPETKPLFDRYLVHGGIEGGPKMFGGLDSETLKTKNAVEIAELAATHYVDSDKVDAFNATHVVDFEGCLKSFLSGQLPDRWELSSEEHVKKLVGILRNFFNYLLHHDVCPEYKDQIDAARSLCDKAVIELWNIKLLATLLPGDFNMACSEIFGGIYQGKHSADRSWMGDTDVVAYAGISPERARHAFKIGIAANASDEMFPKYREQLSAKECRIINSEETGFEITEIIPADETVLALYGQQQSAGLKTLGKMRAKTWLNPNAPDEDLTEDEEAYLKANPPKAKAYEFWLEEDILEKCAIGMKFQAAVRETSFGLTYFDAIGGVFCSFYQVIPNELMEDWREIEKEWLPMKYNRYTAAKKGSQGQENGVEDYEEKGATGDHTELPTDEKEIDDSTEITRKDGHLEAESETPEYNPNLVAAGYDDDFDETPLKTEGEPQEKTVDRNFGVEVREAGEELTEVSGNTDTVLQKNFDVKRIEETD